MHPHLYTASLSLLCHHCYSSQKAANSIAESSAELKSDFLREHWFKAQRRTLMLIRLIFSVRSNAHCVVFYILRSNSDPLISARLVFRGNRRTRWLLKHNPDVQESVESCGFSLLKWASKNSRSSLSRNVAALPADRNPSLREAAAASNLSLQVN